MILNLTNKPCVAGQHRIHALQGGGKGLHGKYIKNLTWCGVEKRSGIALVETDAECTCMACQRIIKEFEIKHKLKDR